MRKTASFDYLPNDHVLIDKEIPGWVIGVFILPAESGYRVVYNVGWIHNGDSRHDDFDGFRLSAAE